MTDQLQRGDVVACAGRYFVVWKEASYEVEAFPIVLGGEAGLSAHAVPIGDELLIWGISEPVAAVLAGEIETLRNVPTLRVIRIGRCSGGLICRIIGAASRAYAAQFFVDFGRDGLDNKPTQTGVLHAVE